MQERKRGRRSSRYTCTFTTASRTLMHQFGSQADQEWTNSIIIIRDKSLTSDAYLMAILPENRLSTQREMGHEES